MSSEEKGQYILGVTWSGNKFRPSDWVERIATAFGDFDASQRLRYNSSVKPVNYRGQLCLFVADSLAVKDPDAHNFVMNFANTNHLLVKSTTEAELSLNELQDVA